MQHLTIILFLVAVAPVISKIVPKTFYARATAVFVCYNSPVEAATAFVAIVDDEYNPLHLDHLYQTPNGEFDYTTHVDVEPDVFDKSFKKPKFFLRKHFDCGCGEVYNTPYIPEGRYYETEAEAIEKPYNYGIIELSFCREEDNAE
uniref:Transthyretin/hydroxyisourate hydrolase domain-containing protein n=1 Tax=Panagrellus redivivus TaxID=6233 RepID=A0A7E4VF53_PANRE